MLEKISTAAVKTAAMITCLTLVCAFILVCLLTAGIFLPWFLRLTKIVCAANIAGTSAAVILYITNSIADLYKRKRREFYE